MTDDRRQAPLKDLQQEPLKDAQQEPAKASRKRGWPLWLRLVLAAIVLAFVWSPFLAMLVRLSGVNPSLAPDAPQVPMEPPTAPGAPQAPRSGGPAPSP